jgi:hypothetical protein
VRQIVARTWTPPEGADPAQFAGDDAQLMAVRQTTMIVANALLEGAGMMACMAYLLEGQPFTLTIVAVLVVFMLFQFPTRERVRAWLERHLALVAESR